MVERTSTTATPLRRTPVQDRSLARVQRMLDVCAVLVDEVGYDGLSTTRLAERAGIAVGSVYQFFPDKRAIVQALTERYLDVYVARITNRVVDGNVTNWLDAADIAIDEYIAMHRSIPGFRTLHFGDVVQHHLVDRVADNDAVIIQRLAFLLAIQFGVADTPRLRHALIIAVGMADALIKLAFRRNPAGEEWILAEAKGLVRDYIYRTVT